MSIMVTFIQFITESASTAYRKHIGWISGKGKEHVGDGLKGFHEDLLPPKLRPKATSLDDYNKAFHAGYTRFRAGHKGSWYDHDSVHGDQKKFHAVLNHIQHHLKNSPYHPPDGNVELRLTDHKGNDHNSTHLDADSAIRHLSNIRRKTQD